MKARIIQHNDQLFLCLATGEMKKLSIREARNFIKNYDKEDNYSILDSDKVDLIESDIANKEPLAVVDDTGLHIYNAVFLRKMLDSAAFPYLTTEEFAEKHNRQRSIVLRLCRTGRLRGAKQINGVWLIPEDTPYPEDARCGIRVHPVQD